MIKRQPLVLDLEAVLVSSVSFALKLASRQRIASKGQNDYVKDQGHDNLWLGLKRAFRNFSTSIPFFHKLILLDLVVGWNRPTRHLASVQNGKKSHKREGWDNEFFKNDVQTAKSPPRFQWHWSPPFYLHIGISQHQFHSITYCWNLFDAMRPCRLSVANFMLQEWRKQKRVPARTVIVHVDRQGPGVGHRHRRHRRCPAARMRAPTRAVIILCVFDLVTPSTTPHCQLVRKHGNLSVTVNFILTRRMTNTAFFLWNKQTNKKFGAIFSLYHHRLRSCHARPIPDKRKAEPHSHTFFRCCPWDCDHWRLFLSSFAPYGTIFIHIL